MSDKIEYTSRRDRRLPCRGASAEGGDVNEVVKALMGAVTASMLAVHGARVEWARIDNCLQVSMRVQLPDGRVLGCSWGWTRCQLEMMRHAAVAVESSIVERRIAQDPRFAELLPPG